MLGKLEPFIFSSARTGKKTNTHTHAQERKTQPTPKKPTKNQTNEQKPQRKEKRKP